MKQHLLRGFGSSYLSGAMPPADMPDEVVAMCENEADAILHSINFAKARFGYTQRDIALLCGLSSDNHLSAYKKGREEMPRKHYVRFAQVTGCNLLAQVIRRDRQQGRQTANDRNDAVLAQMLRAA
jgi:hypothetical protein